MKLFNTKYKFLTYTFLIGIIYFTFFRIVLLLVENEQLNKIPNSTWLVLQALFMGLRFDIVISGYILILPFMILSLFCVINIKRVWFLNLIGIYIMILYILSFLICVADIPYFHHFFTRITAAVLNYKSDLSFVISMIFQEFFFLTFLILYLIINISFVYLVNRLRKKYLLQSESFHFNWRNFSKFSIVFFVSLFVIFLGIRGRIEEKSPIKVGTAYFSDYAFINQLGLNPVFTFMQSYLDMQKDENKEVKYYNDALALKIVQEELGIIEPFNPNYPLTRLENENGDEKKLNVVIILMEGISANHLKYFGNNENITPFLDSLIGVSTFFENAYSSGIHTYNGVYSSLFSYPCLPKKHPMNQVVIETYESISKILKQKNYETMFMTTHDAQFDNMSGFLKSNNFNRMISQSDYPSEKVLSTLGVPDHYMFEWNIPVLNEFSKSKKNFFSVFLTAANHEPEIIPEGIPFKPRSEKLKSQIVEYSDWSLKHFFELAKKEEWYKNTLFVLFSDHGNIYGFNNYDLPLSYFHCPFILFSENKILNDKIDKVCGQIDIAPIILGLLNIRYINNTLGMNILNKERKFIYFSSDDKIGCLNSEWYYIHRMNGDDGLYRYKNNDLKNYITEKKELASEMKNFVFANFQVAENQILNKKTEIK